MSLGSETLIFDHRGDFFLLLEITNELSAVRVTVDQAPAADSLNSEVPSTNLFPRKLLVKNN